MNGPSFRVRVEPSIRSIPAEVWDACARGVPVGETRSFGAKGFDRLENPGEVESKSEQAESKSQRLESKSEAAESTYEEDADNPFVTHAFLSSLEESGAATARPGWPGRHLLVEDKNGASLAAMPAYLKNHSRGEYVFD